MAYWCMIGGHRIFFNNKNKHYNEADEKDQEDMGVVTNVTAAQPPGLWWDTMQERYKHLCLQTDIHRQALNDSITKI